MASILDALQTATGHHQAGRLTAAEQIYRQILAADPSCADAWHLLGLIASQVGQHDVAVDLIRKAIELSGSDAAFHSNLAAALQAQGKLADAEACCRRALELNPQSADAYGNLGNALKDQGQLDEAVEAYRQALALAPNQPQTHYNLANVFQDQGKQDEAAAAYIRALQLNPNFAEAQSNLGTVLEAQGKFDDAAHAYRRAVSLKPDYADAYNNLANVLQLQRNIDEAIEMFRHALALKPDFAEARINLGAAYQGQGRLEEAIHCFRQVLELDPQAVGRKRVFAEAHNNLGIAYHAQGKLDEALICIRRALELKPDFPEGHSNLLFTRQYCSGASLAELCAAHAEFERKYATPLRDAWRPHANRRDPERRLRIGFVSPDFCQHPVGFFLLRLLENLDRDQCEAICYSDRVTQDGRTAALKASAALWRDVRGTSDEKLTEQIRADAIDVLFDLAGHTAHNRLLVFARKPAPLQITWAGYPGTTGLTAIDYILADRYEIPPAAEQHYSERVLRMPDGYVCYDPPPYAPPVAEPPALHQGFVTFGSFNNRAKINAQVIDVWAEILRRVPRSRLLLKNRAMDNASIAVPLKQEFAARGIDPERVQCLGWSSHVDLLAAYGQIDLALDPFPYGGGLTTCEALWMGVPVITYSGETFASRHSLSHLSNAGVTETIASDLHDYIQRAVALAGELPRLAELRRGLRDRMAASPLCNGQRFAQNLEKILRDVWRRWCNL